MTPSIKSFHDPQTFTLTHVIWGEGSADAAIIDPVLDYEAASGRISHELADQVGAFVQGEGLNVTHILETHVHADHLTSAPYLKSQLGGTVAIGAHVGEVQSIFADVYNEGPDFAQDGSQFDLLLGEGDRVQVGTLEIDVWHTPGHTPACISYLVGSAAFIGDTMFSPDFGSARCDFPGGDARTLYGSVRRLLSLAEDTRLFLCHDYMPGGRGVQPYNTVADQRTNNPHIKDGVDEDAFVELREARDAQLSMPALIYPAVQVNMRAGAMPEPESNGQVYFKIPVSG